MNGQPVSFGLTPAFFGDSRVQALTAQTLRVFTFLGSSSAASGFALDECRDHIAASLRAAPAEFDAAIEELTRRGLAEVRELHGGRIHIRLNLSAPSELCSTCADRKRRDTDRKRNKGKNPQPIHGVSAEHSVEGFFSPLPSSSGDASSVAKPTDSAVITKTRARGKPPATPNDGCWGDTKWGIRFDPTNRQWLNIAPLDREQWLQACPAVTIDQELAKAANWCVSNSGGRKQNYRKFLTDWMNRAQQHGGSHNAPRPKNIQPQYEPCPVVRPKPEDLKALFAEMKNES